VWGGGHVQERNEVQKAKGAPRGSGREKGGTSEAAPFVFLLRVNVVENSRGRNGDFKSNRIACNGGLGPGPPMSKKKSLAWNLRETSL